MDRFYGEDKAALWWMGQMGLMVKIKNTMVCIDYYASPSAKRQTPAPIAAEELRGVDVFLGTHDHSDHIDHGSWKIWAANIPAAKFVFPRSHKDAVLSDGVSEENACGLKGIREDRYRAFADKRT